MIDCTTGADVGTAVPGGEVAQTEEIPATATTTPTRHEPRHQAIEVLQRLRTDRATP